MQYDKLLDLAKDIKSFEMNGCYKPEEIVINPIRKSQKYVLISQDPSFETNKTKSEDEAHSGFEKRIISLFFKFKTLFFDKIYWTHCSKVHVKEGEKISKHWDKFLPLEIELAEPQLIITFGKIASEALFGKGNFRDRVGKLWRWKDIDVICSLHPTIRPDVKTLRPKYKFNETWGLIRSKVDFIHKNN
jgi:hypothetical protein